MTNIFGVLNTARVSILTQQSGIEVTGQNLANVNTPGYSRQTIDMQATSPVQIGRALLGTGVQITQVTRRVDNFITSQLNDTVSQQSFYNTTRSALSNLETVFNESENQGLVDNMNRFFNSFQDLSVNSKSLVERSAVLSNAALVTDTTKRLAGDLAKTKANAENQIIQNVDAANTLTTQIADLNKQIHEMERGNITANDLRDKRDVEIGKLAKMMDISVYEDTASNQFMVTTTNGKQLVLGQTAYNLQTTSNGNNYGLMDISINDGQGNLTNITQNINSGTFYAYINLRDNIIPEYEGRLDKLAAGIIREVNRLHTSGYGLDKTAGIDFFNPLNVTARANVNNAGNATITGTVGQQGFVSTDDYRVDITGGGTFSLYNVTTGVVDGTFGYSSGNPVDLGNGMRITLTGAASAGDSFTFSSSENAAITMSVNSVVQNNPNRIAAGQSLAPGDGTNATAIADLQNSLNFSGNSLIAGSGTVTFQEYYGALVSDVGIESMKSDQGEVQQDAIYNQLYNQRESISGVSIDEEMVNIIKFQQAYSASAKLISTVDEMLNVLQQSV